MDKNDILFKSRLENKDEGALVAKSKGAVLGKRIMAAMCLAIMLASFIEEKKSGNGNVVFFAVMSVFNSFLIGEYIEDYRFTKKKSDLFLLIIICLAALVWFGLFISFMFFGD